jgi:hypothetical protein
MYEYSVFYKALGSERMMGPYPDKETAERVAANMKTSIGVRPGSVKVKRSK